MPLTLPAHDGTTVTLDAGRSTPLLVVFLPPAYSAEAEAVLRSLPVGVEAAVVGSDAAPVLEAFAAETGARLLVDPAGVARTALAGQEGGAVLLDPTGAVRARWGHVPDPATLAPLLTRKRGRSTRVDPRLYLPLAAIALFAVVDSLGFWTYTTDDAYITLRYAWHFVQGDGLVFNPGERVEGYSNPTWLALLLLPVAAGWDGMAFGKALGALFHGATVVFAALGAWRLARVKTSLAGAAALLAASATAVSLPLTWWAAGNLETPFYACLLAAAFWRILSEKPDALPVSAALVGLAGFSRPEAPLMAIGLAVARFLVLERDQKRFLRWGLVAAAPIAAWMLFRVVYYGDVVPNTYYHKGGRAPLAEIIAYYGPFIRNEWPFVVAMLLGIVGLAVRRPREALVYAAPVATHLFFLAAVGGDWMANQRFLAPVLPLLAVGAGAGFAALVDRPPAAWPRPVAAVAALVLALLHLGAVVPVRIAETDNDGAFATTPRDKGDWPAASFSTGFGGSNNVVVAWLLQNVAPGATVAYSEIGLVAYAGDWIVQDLVGLTDRDLGGATGLDINDRVEVVHQRRPDWIVLREGGTQNIRAVRAAPWLREEYAIQAGPKQLLVARRKDAAGATPEQALANLERAITVAPRFASFHDARITLAMQIGTEAQKQAACDELETALPYGQDRIRRCRAALAGKGTYAAKAPKGTEAAAVSPAVPTTPDAAAPKTGPRKQGSVGLGWLAVPKTLAGTNVVVEGDTLVLTPTGGTPVATACREGDLPMKPGLTVRWEWSYDGIVPDGKKGARLTARLLDEAGGILPGGYTPTGGMQQLGNARGSNDWEAKEAQVPSVPGATTVRLCIDLPATAGTVRLRNLTTDG